MKTKTFIILLASLFFAVSVAAQDTNKDPKRKFYRWVDEAGEVHYTESLPPDFQDKKHDVIDSEGVIKQTDLSLVPPPPPPAPPPKPSANELPRDASGMQRPAPRFNAAQLKAQQDALLLLRYDSDQEIIDAMQVEIKQLDYDRRLLMTSRKSLMDSYFGNIREAAERQRAGIKVEGKLISDTQGVRKRLDDNTRTLGGLKTREDSIRARFEIELKTYRELMAAVNEKKARLIK